MVDGHVLAGDDLDGFLRADAAQDRRDVVELGCAVPVMDVRERDGEASGRKVDHVLSCCVECGAAATKDRTVDQGQ